MDSLAGSVAYLYIELKYHCTLNCRVYVEIPLERIRIIVKVMNITVSEPVKAGCSVDTEPLSVRPETYLGLPDASLLNLRARANNL